MSKFCLKEIAFIALMIGLSACNDSSDSSTSGTTGTTASAASASTSSLELPEQLEVVTNEND